MTSSEEFDNHITNTFNSKHNYQHYIITTTSPMHELHKPELASRRMRENLPEIVEDEEKERMCETER